LITPGARLIKLREIIDRKGFVRIMEAHNGLSGLVAETTKIQSGDEVLEYDGLWESSLTDSASKGLPDVELVGVESRLASIDQILGVTTKPMIVDGDTGRSAVEFEYLVRNLERLGVSAVIIEDKVFPKRNSLDTSARQTLEDPGEFAKKIERGKKGSLTEEFMIIARLESLIAGAGLADALDRAETYIKAGVDGIMIHSQQKQHDEIIAFADAYGPLCERLGRRPILVCVPTTYNLITDQELADRGFDVMIHANHLLRSAYKAMQQAAEAILVNDRGFEAEPICTSTAEIFTAVGFERIKEQDKEYSSDQRLSIIIPAAGNDPVLPNGPKSMIQIAGQTILDRQIESLRRSGLTNNKVVVVRGHEGSQFTRTDVEYCENDRYQDTQSLYSLFCAKSAMADGFVLVYSDILFNEDLMRRLAASNGDIVLAVDNSYRYHKHLVDKQLDLVVSGRANSVRRALQPNSLVQVNQIGKSISPDIADYEFVGMAYFSEAGAEILQKVFQDCNERGSGPLHESPSLEQAKITDILQEIIDRGFKVQGLETSMGWIEIHNQHDVDTAESELVQAQPAGR
jgi:phosphoenolpyruvate mutase